MRTKWHRFIMRQLYEFEQVVIVCVLRWYWYLILATEIEAAWNPVAHPTHGTETPTFRENMEYLCSDFVFSSQQSSDEAKHCEDTTVLFFPGDQMSTKTVFIQHRPDDITGARAQAVSSAPHISWIAIQSGNNGIMDQHTTIVLLCFCIIAVCSDMTRSFSTVLRGFAV